MLAFDNEAEKQFSGMEHVERISNAMKEWHGEFKKTETEDPTLIALGYSTGSWMLNRWWYDKRPSFAKSNSIVSLCCFLKKKIFFENNLSSTVYINWNKS